MPAELKVCHVIYTFSVSSLDGLKMFHQCGICVIDFKYGGYFSSLPFPPSVSNPENGHPTYAGPNLDLLSVWQSNTFSFYEIYPKLYFYVKHLEKELNTGW